MGTDLVRKFDMTWGGVQIISVTTRQRSGYGPG